MSRIAYDAVGGKAAWVRANLPLPDVMLFYGTGSLDIDWTEAERALFPAGILCEIDQGGAGTPIPTATVRDVENGAWAPGAAVDTSNWHAERRTIYCSRNTLQSVIQDGWTGDIWLAWPGWNGEPLPSIGGGRIVAVQDQWNTDFDRSTILDATWPHAGVTPPPVPPLSVTVVGRIAHIAFGEMAGADHYVINYLPERGGNVVTVGRVIQPKTGTVVHAAVADIPDARGGTLEIFGIVHSKPELIGSRTLP